MFQADQSNTREHVNIKSAHFAQPVKKGKFIAELRERGSVYHAALAARIARRTAYDWRYSDPEFADAWDDALADQADGFLKSGNCAQLETGVDSGTVGRS